MSQESNNLLQLERETLPIFEHRQHILDTVSNNLFAVVTGETGSGKSTQLAQYLVEALQPNALAKRGQELWFDLFSEKEATDSHEEEKQKQNQRDSEPVQPEKRSLRVVVTQPRRVAAVQMAKRVAEERETKVGEKVGYSIRFEEEVSEETEIKYVTDGILLRECLSDSALGAYDVVILDEAHERSLFTDVLFTLAKQAVYKRRGGLRLIITSATLDTELFSCFLHKCPVIAVSGRCFPVVVSHVGDIPEALRVEQCVKASINIHLQEQEGDILVFLTGFEECEAAASLCLEKLKELISKGKEVPPLLIVALYGAQKSSEQQKAFTRAPPGARKVVFSTNIAETSLTVDGVAYVVDAGYVKQKRYNAKTGIESLQIQAISKVQAVQRTGRAGRTQQGKCFRLYSENTYKTIMPDQTLPEIHRANLSSVILLLLQIGVPDVLAFDFIDPPHRQHLLFALRQLYFLRAIDKEKQLTQLGKQMARFPLDPTYSSALLAAKILKCSDQVAGVVSLLSTENIWAPVPGRTSLQKEYRERLAHAQGDLLSLLEVHKASRGRGEIWMHKHYMQARALRQAERIKDQLLACLERCDTKIVEKYLAIQPSETGVQQAVLKSFAVGLFMNAAKRVAGIGNPPVYTAALTREVLSLGDQCAFALKEKYPEWLVFSEVAGLRSKRAVIRQASEVKFDWIEAKMPLLAEVNHLIFGEKLSTEVKQFVESVPKPRPIPKREMKVEGKERADIKKMKIAQARAKYLARKLDV